MVDTSKALNKGKVKTAILQNVLWQLIPILAALVSVPYTISVFGKELFSIYALAVAYIVGLNYLHMGGRNKCESRPRCH